MRRDREAVFCNRPAVVPRSGPMGVRSQGGPNARLRHPSGKSSERAPLFFAEVWRGIDWAFEPGLADDTKRKRVSAIWAVYWHSGEDRVEFDQMQTLAGMIAPAAQIKVARLLLRWDEMLVGFLQVPVLPLEQDGFKLNRCPSPLPSGERSICAANRVRGVAPTIDRNPSPGAEPVPGRRETPIRVRRPLPMGEVKFPLQLNLTSSHHALGSAILLQIAACDTSSKKCNRSGLSARRSRS
jgi:hypothetical protein